jgi:hypothetical protein
LPTLTEIIVQSTVLLDIFTEEMTPLLRGWKWGSTGAWDSGSQAPRPGNPLHRRLLPPRPISFSCEAEAGASIAAWSQGGTHRRTTQVTVSFDFQARRAEIALAGGVNHRMG